MPTPFMTIRQLKCRKCGTIGIWTHVVEADGEPNREDIAGDVLVDDARGLLVCGQCGYTLGTSSSKAATDFSLFVDGKLQSRCSTLNAAREAAVAPILRGKAVRIKHPFTGPSLRVDLYDYDANEWVKTQ